MRLSDLLDRPVFDIEGRRLGQVQDVLVSESEPLLSGRPAALIVEGLVVGGHQGTRLGFERGGARGPWPLSAILRRFERRARFVPWDVVAGCEAGEVRIGLSADRLEPPPQIR
jgi:sporulation protein YlmC with PRC-barrel domain